MFDRMPDELSSTVFRFFHSNQKVHLQTVSNKWRGLLRSDMLRTENDVKDYEEFAKRMTPLHRELKNLVIEGIYTLPFAEAIHQLCNLNVVKRQAELLSDDDVNLMPQDQRQRTHN